MRCDDCSVEGERFPQEFLFVRHSGEPIAGIQHGASIMPLPGTTPVVALGARTAEGSCHVEK